MKKVTFVILTILMVGFLTLNGQSLNFKIGAFYPSMESDLWDVNLENLAFDKSDMLGTYLGAELEFFMGRYFSFALEGGYYHQDVFTEYKEFEHEDGTPIYHDLSLKIASMEADLKIYPLGHRRLFNPFIGGGIGLYTWKYIQGGEFIDFEEMTVFEGEAHTKTTTIGFNAKGGFVYRFRRSMGISFEARYVYLKGQQSSLFEGFNKLDLSGLTLNIGVQLFLR